MPDMICMHNGVFLRSSKGENLRSSKEKCIATFFSLEVFSLVKVFLAYRRNLVQVTRQNGWLGVLTIICKMVPPRSLGSPLGLHHNAGLISVLFKAIIAGL